MNIAEGYLGNMAWKTLHMSVATHSMFGKCVSGDRRRKKSEEKNPFSQGNLWQYWSSITDVICFGLALGVLSYESHTKVFFVFRHLSNCIKYLSNYWTKTGHICTFEYISHGDSKYSDEIR